MTRVLLVLTLAAGVAAFAPPIVRAFGGWAVITVEDLPETIATNDTTQIAFVVRAHGHNPVNVPQANVSFASARTTSNVPAIRAGQTGRYVARFVAPADGDWTITIRTGWPGSEVMLHPIRAVGTVTLASSGGAPSAAFASASPPRMSDPVERGRRLFVAKGCITCHVHDGADRPTLIPNLPNLTHSRLDAAWLARYIADPTIRPPTRTGGFRMPNLQLKQAEIGAIVTFLTPPARAGGTAASARQVPGR